MAEELAFHQFGRNRAAVDRHERAAGTGTLLVDQPGNQFLSHAGFAGDVDRRLVARELADGGAHLLHCRRIADQPVAAIAGRGSRAAVALFLGQAQGGADQSAQHLDVDRLGDEVEGTGLQCVDRGVDVAIGSDHRHRHVRMFAGDQLDHFLSVAVGKAHVGEAEIVRALGQGAACIADRTHCVDLQVHAAQRDRQQLANVAFIVDDQYGLCGHRRSMFPEAGC